MSGIDRTWQRSIRKIFFKFFCVTASWHAAQCRFQYEKFRFFLTCAELDFYEFFSSMNVIVYELFFVFSSHPKWLIYDLKKCGKNCVVFRLLEQREAHHWRLKSLQKKMLKSFLCAILSPCFRTYYPYVSVVGYD